VKDERQAAGGGRIADPAAFEAAFRQHFPLIYRFVARRVGSALAEDLAAETFAMAYRRRATFDPHPVQRRHELAAAPGGDEEMQSGTRWQLPRPVTRRPGR
jgi:hypothetical protein